MLYDVGLILSVAIGGWLALDYMMAENWGRRSPAIGLLGGFGALWAASEILFHSAQLPGDFALARRLLYLGVFGGTFSWFWVGVEANSPAWYRRDRHRILFLAVPYIALYSTLFWAPDGIFISLYSEHTSHGPLFFVNAAISWTLISVGLWNYAAAALRLGRVSPLRAISLVASILAPLLLNMLYSFGALGSTDPTAALFGATALMIRFGVVDPGLALYLPLARKDIVEQLAVGVVVADLDGSVIDSNASARKLLGVDDPNGESFDSLCQSLDETIEVTRFPLESHVALTGTAAVLTDRHHAVEAERRLKLAGRLEAVGSLTAGMAHEINNPLAFIHSNLNLIEKLLAELTSPEVSARLPDHLKQLSQDGAESLVDAKDGIERISLLVSRLKDFARETSDRQTQIDVGEAAHRACAVASVGLAPDAVRVVTSTEASIRSDEPVIVQILVNLVLNAVQASTDQPDVTLEVLRNRNEIELRVSDRGAGLEPEVLERVFDPFFTTKESGSGLGLSISFELAQQVGGRIAAVNRPGGGAIFSLYLPLDPEESA